MHHLCCITCSASPAVHSLQYITYCAPPAVHHLLCITCAASPALHHAEHLHSHFPPLSYLMTLRNIPLKNIAHVWSFCHFFFVFVFVCIFVIIIVVVITGTSVCSGGHKSSENIWFSWSKPSISGMTLIPHKRTTREDSATQLLSSMY